MAKTATITVNVNNTQFNQFVRNFNAFSAKVGTLNTQFKQISTTIQTAQKAAQALNNTMQNLFQMTMKPFASLVNQITGHFLKWSAIIGGVTALLGMGGGLFGIDRLANSIMQRRRMVMGLGGTYGGTQASLIYNQSLLSNPGDVLRNIRQGTAGNMEQMVPLMSMGIPFGTSMKPEDILNNIMKRIPELLKGVPKGLELTVLNAYGLNKIFTDPLDLIRLTTEAGRKELAEKTRLEEQRRKDLDLDPKVTRAWSDFAMQLQSAGSQIQKILGEKLVSMAPHLERLSQAFVHAFEVIMNTSVVEKVIRKLTEWMDKFSKYVEKGEFEKDLKQFVTDVESWLPTLKQLGADVLKFADALKKVTDVLSAIWNALKFLDNVEKKVQEFGANRGASAFSMGQAAAPRGLAEQLGNPLTAPTTPSATAPATTAPASKSAASALPAGVGGGFGGGYTAPGATRIPTLPPGVGGGFGGGYQAPGGSIGGSNRTFNFGGGFGGGYTGPQSAFMSGNKVGGMNLGGSSQFATNASAFNQKFASAAAAGGSFHGGTSVNSASVTQRFAMAAGKSVPQETGSALSMNIANTSRSASFRGGQRGPLSADNWQMSRTAALTVRNVPGSNVFMSGTGMSVT
jgi:hypothetical protein